jgi:hypothetical protein
MKTRRFGIAAALITTPFIGLPAWGAACPVFTRVANNVAVTFGAGDPSCDVDGVVMFSNVLIRTTGLVTLGGLSPFIQGNELGLTLNYSANAAPGFVSSDVLWTYEVTTIGSGVHLVDAFTQLTGVATATGTATLGEQLIDPFALTPEGFPRPTTAGSIALTEPNTSQMITSTPGGPFDPRFEYNQLFVLKDQGNFAGTAGSAFTSAMTDAFSVRHTPAPIVGAGLPGLVIACGGLLAWWRRRRQLVA